MSLYYVQKLIYDVNRDEAVQAQVHEDLGTLLGNYELTEEESAALSEPDIGLLYVMGVNGQLLMNDAAVHNIGWDDYIAAMREGVRQHGPVRAGLYAMVGEV